MDFELPRLADTLVEGTVTRWLKKAGDRVGEGEALVEIETDKVNSELQAPADGVLEEILVAEGVTVPVGAVLARISVAGDAPRLSSSRTPAPTLAADSLSEHLRRSAAAVPQGACVREIPAEGLERLPQAVAAAADGIEVAWAPPSRAHLAMPALAEGQAALVAPGAERQGRRYITLCYDRRQLDDWSADQLLRRIASNLQFPPLSGGG
jgi:pyruvate/2-oxoglutarate dehydrogenase complex dihydrolipoamide acyltransferase (E2) component